MRVSMYGNFRDKRTLQTTRPRVVIFPVSFFQLRNMIKTHLTVIARDALVIHFFLNELSQFRTIFCNDRIDIDARCIITVLFLESSVKTREPFDFFEYTPSKRGLVKAPRIMIVVF